MAVQIAKASEDKRNYRGLQLENGLKILLVSDPTTDKAAAAMDVNVGHMSDPWELPGLAHFLEHMLFLGTDKYPDENSYSQYISQHGGSNNAYTASDHTNYYFDITPEFLPEALDRFSQFFLTPLFTESATDREVQAVNSENEKNLASDPWRQQQLERSLSKKGHDYGKFGTGNSETLKNGDVREELLKFHRKYYSSNIMGLAVVGNQSLDELEGLVQESFINVENKNVTPSIWKDHPYDPAENGGTITHVVPIKDIRSLNLTFPIPDYQEHYTKKPVSYVSHLIGHEGKGSLLSELKNLGYVNNLVAGLSSGSKGFDFFIVNVDLTEKGLEHIDDIIKLVFQYFNMLRVQGAQEWVYTECKKINDMLFRFKDKESPMSYATNLASSLRDYPLEEILTGPWIMKEFRPDLVQDVLNRLTPQNVYVMAVAKKFEEKANLEEKWYGTKYCSEKIPAEKLESWSNAPLNKNLNLPGPNEFIPSEFDLAERDTDHHLGANVPSIIKETETTRLWYLQDDEFKLPKACLTLELFSTVAYIDPHYSNLNAMFVTVLNDALTEFSYDAELAGLWYSLIHTSQGITLYIRGYQEKQGVLLDKILSMLKDFKVDEKRFEVLKEARIRELKNMGMDQPHKQASYRSQIIMTDNIWTREEKLEAAENDDLSPQALTRFAKEFMSRIHVEAFFHGNLTPKKALELLDVIENRIGKDNLPIPNVALLRPRTLELQPSETNYFEITNDIHKSSCIFMLLQVGNDETRLNTVLDLFSQIVREPCFDTLRTKEQLGYIVWSSSRKTSGDRGWFVLVQSNRKPVYLDNRIESFIQSARELIKTMSDEEFNRHKKALADLKLEKPKRLSGRSDKIWNEIYSQRYNFDRVAIEVADLELLTREDVIEFYDKFIASKAPERRKLAVHVTSTLETDEENSVKETSGDDATKQQDDPGADTIGNRITDVTKFKAGHPLKSISLPFIELDALKRNPSEKQEP